jgi:nicotinamidase-related amidase
MMKNCLIVIDAQESFRHRPYYTAQDMPAYLAAQNALIAGCVARGVPVVRIFHVDGPAAADNAFALESGYVRPIEGLAGFAAAATFHKSRHSALVGTGLDVWLRQNQIGKIIVSGIRTEQCCETTTRHASDLGYAVDYVLDATLTWDMQQPDGKTLNAADIKMRTATVLQERFAQVLPAHEALKALKPLAQAVAH